MPVVAMDSSALMMPVELGVRVFDELDRLLGEADLVAPRAVVDELDRLAGAGSREATAARVGLDLAADRCRVVEAGGADAPAGPGVAQSVTGDDALLALAEAGAVDYVVTTDRALRERLLGAGVPVVGARGRNTLAVVRP